MRHTKLVRRLAVVVIAVVGLATVLDVVALRVAESRAAAGFAQATAAERASVGFGGFPFLPRLLRGRAPLVRLEAIGLSGAGLRVASLTASAKDVRFSPLRAIALMRSEHAPRTRVSARGPIGRVEISELDLSEFVRSRISIVHDVHIRSSGVEVRLFAEDGTITEPVRFLPRLESRRFVLRLVSAPELPRNLRAEIEGVTTVVDLPPVLEGITAEVSLAAGSITIELAGAELAVIVGEGGIHSAMMRR